MEFKSFYIQHTQGKVNHEDGQVPKPSDSFGGVLSRGLFVFVVTLASVTKRLK
jgi:hypothetical protein